MRINNELKQNCKQDRNKYEARLNYQKYFNKKQNSEFDNGYQEVLPVSTLSKDSHLYKAQDFI